MGYSVKEKAETLVILQSNDGNISQTSRDTGVSRRSIRDWQKEKDEIFKAWNKVKKLQEDETSLSTKEAETQVKQAQVGENYQLAKEHMANTFGKITQKATQQVISKMGELSAKDAMWVASTGLDKILKLKGEPDQVIEVRNTVVGKVVDKLVEAVAEGVIDKTQAEQLSNKFDEIEEADYEEVE